MKIKKNTLIFIAIIILGFVLRFYRLGSLPSLNADEAAIGYNVFSLIETGKDEHGNVWPLQFQSFNDYKPGGFFYVVLPFVKLFGLNVWAVRIPGALLGGLTVVVLYFFVKKVFLDQKLALIASFLLAISPWHIHFSRGAWEVNAASFMILVGLWLLFVGFEKSKYLYGAMIFFVFSLYTYHAARLVVPLLVLMTMWVYRSRLRAEIIFPGILGFVLLLPLSYLVFFGGGLERASGVGILADVGPINRVNEQRGAYRDFNSVWPKLVHNRFVNYGLLFLENWGKHYDGEFLFNSGDEIQRNKVPETGLLYLMDLVFLCLGAVALVRKWGKLEKMIIGWILIAPLAAALTFQSPHSLRAHNLVIPLVIISGMGFKMILEVLEKRKLVFGYVILGVVMAWSVTRYLIMYYYHMNKEYSYSSQYGIEELVDYVTKTQERYDKIIVTDRYDQPYILFLFYMKYQPEKFQQESSGLTERDIYGFSTVRKFGKYEFKTINFDQDRPNYPNSLIVGTKEEIPDEANIVREILFPNGEVVFRIVAN